MTTLDSDFEDKLADAVLPDRDEMRAEAERVKDEAEANWNEYMAANDYDLQHITDGARITDVNARGRTRSARVEWPFSSLFEYGVEPHTIEASSAPKLAFEWPAPPEGTRPQGAPPFVVDDEVDWGSVTGGIGKARAVRDALQWWRGEVRR